MQPFVLIALSLVVLTNVFATTDMISQNTLARPPKYPRMLGKPPLAPASALASLPQLPSSSATSLFKVTPLPPSKNPKFDAGSLSDYTVNYEKPLGKGGYGTVYVGVSKINSAKKVAVKVLNLATIRSKHPKWSNGKLEQIVEREANICRKLVHPNLIPCNGPFYDSDALNSIRQPSQRVSPMSGKAHLLIEFMENGDLFDFVRSGQLSKAKANCGFHQIVSGLSFLHSQSISHQDIKLENILVAKDGWLMKIADFGLSIDVTKDGLADSTMVSGSLRYLAPELFNVAKHGSHKSSSGSSQSRDEDDWQYNSFAGDIFAAGVTFYAMRTGAYPWNVARPTDKQWMQYFHNPEFIFEHNMHEGARLLFDEEEKKMVLKMLANDPTDRISMKELQESEWFKSLAKSCR